MEWDEKAYAAYNKLGREIRRATYEYTKTILDLGPRPEEPKPKVTQGICGWDDQGTPCD